MDVPEEASAAPKEDGTRPARSLCIASRPYSLHRARQLLYLYVLLPLELAAVCYGSPRRHRLSSSRSRRAPRHLKSCHCCLREHAVDLLAIFVITMCLATGLETLPCTERFRLGPCRCAFRGACLIGFRLESLYERVRIFPCVEAGRLSVLPAASEPVDNTHVPFALFALSSSLEAYCASLRGTQALRFVNITCSPQEVSCLNSARC